MSHELPMTIEQRIPAVASSDLLGAFDPDDVVYTPDWAAKDIVDFFKPSGRILEPCKGGGAFMRQLPPETEWCEIQEGRDFYAWNERVDWIVSNPPYKQIPKWLRRSMHIATEIVYVIPTRSIFFGPELLRDIYAFGGIRHMRHYGGGRNLNFPFGIAVAAIHFSKGWRGDIGVSFAPNEKS